MCRLIRSCSLLLPWVQQDQQGVWETVKWLRQRQPFFILIGVVTSTLSEPSHLVRSLTSFLHHILLRMGETVHTSRSLQSRSHLVIYSSWHLIIVFNLFYVMPVLSCFNIFCYNLPVVLPSEIDSSEVVWLEELEDHQPPEGFVVARGLYKGPVIRR